MKITKIMLSLWVFVFGLLIGYSAAYAYKLWYKNGFSPVPTSVYLYSNSSSEIRNTFQSACNTWNSAGAGKLVYCSESTHTNTKFPYENNRNEVTRGNRGNNGYAMRTTKVSYSDVWSELYEVDMDINTTYSFSSTASAGTVDYQSIFTHELGHLLGLNDLTDSSDSAATMYFKITLGDSKWRTLTSDDKNGIMYIYN